ncbi:hypothetical protein F5883DRAFT_526748 [Diaporthe sp. PMI_573]|nr:hypothetical protein F5883DRAFT_526748 [Diaporthaceae sp. PMI_573]
MSIATHSRNGSSVSGSNPGPKSAHSGDSFNTAGSSKTLWNNNNRSSGGASLSHANLAQHIKDNSNRKNGWPLLAKLMEEQPGFEAFSRFRELNIKNLLYYQVELETIRIDLEDQEKYDGAQPPPSPEREYYKDAEKMLRSGSSSGPEANSKPNRAEQWKLVLKLRRCLHDYNEALLQYSQISALPEPNSRNMAELVKWVIKPDYGDFCIGNCGSDIWGKLYTPPKGDPTLVQLFQKLGHGVLSIIMFWKKKTPQTRSDLVAPGRHKKVDTVARWIVYDAIPWTVFFWNRITCAAARKKDGSSSTGKLKVQHVELEKQVGQQTDKKEEVEEDPRLMNITLVSERIVSKITSFFATVVACLLPTGAIAVLTTADTTLHKLLWIGGFTMLFSMGLSVFTSEISRVQIFMAAAAFSAVLVVFVQGQ